MSNVESLNFPPVPKPAIKPMAYLVMTQDQQADYLLGIIADGRTDEFIQELTITAVEQNRRARIAESKLAKINQFTK